MRRRNDIAENNEGHMSTFSEFYNLTSLFKEPKHFKIPNYSWWNNLISKSHPHSSQKSSVIETGPSDFHKITDFIIKAIFHRLKLSAVETEEDTHVKPAFREFPDGITLINKATNDLLSKKGPWKILESIADYRILNAEFLASANEIEEA